MNRASTPRGTIEVALTWRIRTPGFIAGVLGQPLIPGSRFGSLTMGASPRADGRLPLNPGPTGRSGGWFPFVSALALALALAWGWRAVAGPALPAAFPRLDWPAGPAASTAPGRVGPVERSSTSRRTGLAGPVEEDIS